MPLTEKALLAALDLPEAEARKALLRTLEYFGATRISEDVVEIPLGIKPPIQRTQLPLASVPIATLSSAARQCIVDVSGAG